MNGLNWRNFSPKIRQLSPGKVKSSKEEKDPKHQ